MVSTPNALVWANRKGSWRYLSLQIFLDYTYGIGKIYAAEEIEKAKQSSSFER
jgi:hypothetical protein